MLIDVLLICFKSLAWGEKKSEYHDMEFGALCSGYKHVPSETVHLFFPVYRIPSEATLSSSEKVEPVTTIAAVLMFTTKF